MAPETPVEQQLFITNRDDEILEVQIVSTCDCLEVESDKISIRPGKNGAVILYYDPSDDSGEVEKFFIIRTNKKGLEKVPFSVHGNVIEKRPAAEGSPITDSSYRICEPCEEMRRDMLDEAKAAVNEITLRYYYSPGCRECEKFITGTIPALEKDLGINIYIVKRDILDPESYLEFTKITESSGEKKRAFPALLAGKTLLQGNREIEKNIRGVLEALVDHSPASPAQKKEAVGDVPGNLALLPAPLAGLIDGINPCAFTTIICLLTALTLAGRRRREILLMGIFFTSAVFVTYLLIRLGFFKTIRLANSFPVVSRAIRWFLISIQLIFSGLSVCDYSLIRAGKTNQIILKLPAAFKKRIQHTIKGYARSAALVGSSLLLGFLVSLFELGCTGQVYFPFIVYIVRIKKEATGYLMLLIYNISFILPLIIVFVVTYPGISSRRLSELFQKHMGKVKIALSLLFLALAVLTILT